METHENDHVDDLGRRPRMIQLSGNDNRGTPELKSKSRPEKPSHRHGSRNRSRSRHDHRRQSRSSSRNKRKVTLDITSKQTPYDVVTGAGPMLSFQDFTSQNGYSRSSRESKQKYDEYSLDYCDRVSGLFFDAHKLDEWFQEAYSPIYLQEIADKRRNWCCQENSKFCSELLSYGQSFLRSISNSSNRSRVTLPLSDSNEEAVYDGRMPSNIWDCCVRIDGLPATCRSSQILSSIETSTGLRPLNCYFTDPKKQHMHQYIRSCFMVFPTRSDAKLVSDTVHSLDVTSSKVGSAAQQQQVQVISISANLVGIGGNVMSDEPLIWKSSPSNSGLIRSKLQSVTSAMDANMGIEPTFNKWLDDHHISNMDTDYDVIDLYLAYLNRVHLTCLSSSSSCNDYEGDVINETRIMHRHIDVDGPITDEIILNKLDLLMTDNINNTLDESHAVKRSNLVKSSMSSLSTSLTRKQDEFTSSSCSQDKDNKVRCNFCLKLFKSREFILKHIIVKHRDEYDASVLPVVEPAMRRLYDLTARRSLPISSVEMTINGSSKCKLVPYQKLVIMIEKSVKDLVSDVSNDSKKRNDDDDGDKDHSNGNKRKEEQAAPVNEPVVPPPRPRPSSYYDPDAPKDMPIQFVFGTVVGVSGRKKLALGFGK